MSLYDGRTLEADYRQLVRDNLRKLEAERIDRENRHRIESGYFQMVDGYLRFVQVVPTVAPKRPGNRDRQVRQSNRTASQYEAKRVRQSTRAGK